MGKKIIIDTDPGIDDALAIILAVKSGVFDIQAITTVCGNSTIDNTTRNAQFILNYLDAKIPLYSGAKRPLKRELIQASVHGKNGLEGISPKNKYKITNNAASKIVEIIDKNPGDITLVALGPLTNIAKALLKAPEIMKNIKEIVLMGGAIRVPGNKNRVAEFNIFVDPEAADVVFSVPVKKTVIPLDACNKVLFSIEDFEKIQEDGLRTLMLKMIPSYINNLGQDEGIPAAVMYDPLPVYYLLNPHAARTYTANLAIETKGTYTRGMTVADLRTKTDAVPNSTVIDFIDPTMFQNDFLSILNGTPYE